MLWLVKISMSPAMPIAVSAISLALMSLAWWCTQWRGEQSYRQNQWLRCHRSGDDFTWTETNSISLSFITISKASSFVNSGLSASLEQVPRWPVPGYRYNSFNRASNFSSSLKAFCHTAGKPNDDFIVVNATDFMCSSFANDFSLIVLVAGHGIVPIRRTATMVVASNFTGMYKPCFL